jgi:hypothetical protein
MTPDPYFTEVGKSQSAPASGCRWIKRIVLVPLLLFSGCHMLLTGSPIPLWYIESLHDPVAVAAIADESLVLADGRQVRLPYIRKLPKDDPTFARAVSHGVEIGGDGKVVGLIEPCRMCGNDPVTYRRLRIDLSELAGSLDPGGIDDAIVSPAWILDFKERYGSSRDRRGVPYLWRSQASQLREIYESSESRCEQERSSPTSTVSTAPR